jgi:uncharacterized protein
METHDPTPPGPTDAPADRPLGADPAAPVPTIDEPRAGPVGPEPRRTGPVAEAERLTAVDVLRGVALLGILAMNVVTFAWPFSAYENPDLSGGPSLANRAAWLVNEVVFSGKMMSLFSMLFGAGLVLMADRAEGRGVRFAGVYYRRILWLLAIGLVHAYVVWSGDILVAYAVSGLFLFFFRAMSPGRLIALGAVLIVGSSLVFPVFGLGLGLMKGLGTLAERSVDPSAVPGGVGMAEGWREARAMFAPTEEQFEGYRGGFWEVFRHRAVESFSFQAFFLTIFGWGIAGRMLLGMGLMKLGVFSAGRSSRFYWTMLAVGYGVGLPMTIFGAADLWRTDFDPIRGSVLGSSLVMMAMVPVALGHAAAVMLAVKAGALPRLTARLAAVGRMALTNYLVQSLIGTSLFYGYGLGLFGKVDRPGLWLIVLAVWALQLWYSPLWLSRFRFGPMEWLWRSLTYMKPQPMRAGGG